MTEEQKIWELLADVPDPEVPVLSVHDLGIIRSVQVVRPGESVDICVTPTYTGCPAMDVISMNIRMRLLSQGYKDVQISTVLSPAWTTEWISEEGRQKLAAYGVAPPTRGRKNNDIHLFREAEQVRCPLCGSMHTVLISEFGSTACKSLYRCMECQEPFDYFKCH